ncbi:leucine zipper protein 1 [Eucyclogobius newberryi]|uniref:leucine zipper protein 1 n=1 Tax=Eucyclogobius newberryi TaxID=166745 RepID=UPI003B5C663A
MSEHKDMTHRHLRHKLQSLGRRLDELEEATNKLQKAEDELLELQDKIIQAEGSNSTLLSDIETLRKRLLKIQGKDEEVRKAEDLCRTVREKLEEEESLTKDLKAEIERLQRRMGDLEKLEEAFGKSKSDCSQLCLSLNEEKNQTKKLSSELEALKGRLKEIEGSETRLERAEQALSIELEKLKGFTHTFMSDRKRLLEKQREDEKIILKLTEQLEQEKIRLGISGDSGRADFERSRIEDELTSTSILTSKLAARKKSLDYLKLADGSMVNKVQNVKNYLEGSQEEDNKVKELTLEVEKLKNRLKLLEIVEEDLKKSESKNGELHEKFQMERNRTRQLGEQVEQLRTQLCGKGFGNGSANSKVLENGKAENEEIISKVSYRQEKPKYQRIATVSEPMSPKQRNREMSPQHKRETKLKSLSEDGSPKGSRRPQSPLHKAKRTPKSPTVTSKNGLKETSRLPTYNSMNTSQKVSVLSRYPPAANDPKPTRSGYKQQDGGTKKLRPEKFSKLYVGSDSESNNSDIVADVTTNSISVSEKDIASDQESTETIQESSMSKANGSYTAYRSHVSPLLGADQGSEGHSSASETESTSSRPLEPEQILETTSTTVSSRVPTSRLSRNTHTNDSHSEGSSSRSSFDEELLNRAHFFETGQQGTPQTLSEIEIQRVCSPREALRSKAVIKPAIVEIDRKEMLFSEPYAANGKPKISTKPLITSTSKMTSSITIYPNDPSSSRTSSRSSSLSSEPLSTKERHTSTSNFLIGASSDHHGSISVPYEISIPKSDLTLRTSLDQDCEEPDTSSGYKPHHASTTTSHRCYQRNTFSLQSMDSAAADFTDPESVFESSNSTAAVTSWRRTSQISNEDGAPDMKNVTVRSTWRNRGAGLAEEGAVASVRGGIRGMADGGSEDEAEVATWRAYRATTVDTEDALQRTGKPSPAEVYMRRINHTKDPEDPAGARRAKRSQSPESSQGRTIPHAPVTSQSWGRAHTTPNMAEAAESVSHSPASWRRPLPTTNSSLLGSSKTPGAPSSRAELWARGQGSGARTEGSARPWNQRQIEHH